MLRRVLVTATLALAGVCLTYAVADGRGILPWMLTVALGLVVGYATRGGWLAGMAGVIAGHVVVGYVRAAIREEAGPDFMNSGGEGLLIGIVLFTPGYLFGAASRLQDTLRARGRAPTDGVEPIPDAQPSGLSPREMVGLGCGILVVFGLGLAYIVFQLTRGGGY